MKPGKSKLKLGIVGCGAIGSRIALSVARELNNNFMLSSLYDIDPLKAQTLAKRLNVRVRAAQMIDALISGSDIIVEAVNTAATVEIVRKSLKADKDILVMSVGRLLGHSSLFALAHRSKGAVLLPSGAVAGLDAVKAASLAGITSLLLISRKPPSGFVDNAYLLEKGIDIKKMTRETVLFDGAVTQAVRFFPQNINVAAAVALAAGPKAKLRVRIIASPDVKCNTHELVLEGVFGRIMTTAENTICPDNPKTSYLAVLSAIRTLKDFASNVKVGT